MDIRNDASVTFSRRVSGAATAPQPLAHRFFSGICELESRRSPQLPDVDFCYHVQAGRSGSGTPGRPENSCWSARFIALDRLDEQVVETSPRLVFYAAPTSHQWSARRPPPLREVAIVFPI
jgi:hypothetical protein